jgi:hypothetical protein
MAAEGSPRPTRSCESVCAWVAVLRAFGSRIAAGAVPRCDDDRITVATRLSRLVFLAFVAAPLLIGVAATVADGINGGQSPDEGWEEGVVLTFGSIGTIGAAVFGFVAGVETAPGEWKGFGSGLVGAIACPLLFLIVYVLLVWGIAEAA